MRIKVNSNELNNISRITLDNKDAYDKCIDSCLSGMALISEGWQGDDATYSIKKIKKYFKELKKISIAYENIGNYISYASKEYNNKDNSFNDKFSAERQSYESEFNDV